MRLGVGPRAMVLLRLRFTIIRMALRQKLIHKQLLRHLQCDLCWYKQALRLQQLWHSLVCGKTLRGLASSPKKARDSVQLSLVTGKLGASVHVPMMLDSPARSELRYYGGGEKYPVRP